MSIEQPIKINRHYPPIPLVGVGAAVFNGSGQVLLVQRGRPPGKGSWGLPGGMLELGETLVEGVRREVREECGVEVEIGDLVATFEPIVRDDTGRIEYHYVVIDFWAKYLSGEAVAQDDADAVAWVDPAELARYSVKRETIQVILDASQMFRTAHNGLDC